MYSIPEKSIALLSSSIGYIVHPLQFSAELKKIVSETYTRTRVEISVTKTIKFTVLLNARNKQIKLNEVFSLALKNETNMRALHNSPTMPS